jgi:hypothetical protein
MPNADLVLLNTDYGRDNLQLSATNFDRLKNLLNGKDDSIKYIAIKNEKLDFKELIIRIG